MTTTVRIFVFAAESAVSKAGRPYSYQRVQLIQSPSHPDAFERHFVQEGAEPLPSGMYDAELYVASTPTGNRIRFASFSPVSAK